MSQSREIKEIASGSARKEKDFTQDKIKQSDNLARVHHVCVIYNHKM